MKVVYCILSQADDSITIEMDNYTLQLVISLCQKEGTNIFSWCIYLGFP